MGDGTPRGTRIYYVTEEDTEIEITCANKLKFEITPEQFCAQINLVADVKGLDLQIARDSVTVKSELGWMERLHGESAQVIHAKMAEHGYAVSAPQPPEDCEAKPVWTLDYESAKSALVQMKRTPIKSDPKPDTIESDSVGTDPSYWKTR